MEGENMKKGFVFDLDGVITDTAKFHYIAWKELGESIGITIDLQFNEQLKGISRMDSLDRILTYGGKENDYTQEEKEAMAAKKNEAYVKLLDDLTPDDLLPGVKAFLDEAREKKSVPPVLLHLLPGCQVRPSSRYVRFSRQS